MNLQNRNLNPNNFGDDIKLLQGRFLQPFYIIVDQEGFFDSPTFTAVQEFQCQCDLQPADIVENIIE